MLMPIRGSRTYPKNPQNKSRLPQLSSSSSQSPQKVCLQRWLTMCPWCRTDIDCLIPNNGCTGLCFCGGLENRAQHAKWWEQMLILCELHLFSGAVVHSPKNEHFTLLFKKLGTCQRPPSKCLKSQWTHHCGNWWPCLPERVAPCWPWVAWQAGIPLFFREYMDMRNDGACSK